MAHNQLSNQAAGGMKHTLKEFTSNTTAHGWGNIHQRTTKLSKAVWIIICLGCTGVAIWQIITIVVRYSLFETNDRIKVNIGQIEFPAVTVCPLVGISNAGNLKLRNHFNDGNLDVTAAKYFGHILVSENSIIESNASEDLRSEKSEFYNVFYDQLYTYQGFFENAPNLLNYRHKQEEFIPDCRYQGKLCQKSDFHEWNHHEYYACFTFNGVNSSLSNPHTKIIGPKGGLSLVIFLDAGKFVTVYNTHNPTSGSQGLRVVIHEKGTLPDPENDGFDVEPGHSVGIALSVNERRLMKPPWGECADHTSKVYGGYTYTKKHCELRCLQKLIYKTCGCIKSSLPIDAETADKNFCLKIQIEEWLKLTTDQYNKTLIQNDMNNLRCQNHEYDSTDIHVQDGCECREKCTYHTYDMTLSQSEWPMRGVEIDFYCRLIKTMENYINSSLYDAFHEIFAPHCNHGQPAEESDKIRDKHGDNLRQNFIRLNVYFKDLEVKTTNQIEDFTINSMISEIGGSLGFFVGMSIITIVEVILMCWNIFGVLRKKIVVSPTQPESERDKKDQQNTS